MPAVDCGCALLVARAIFRGKTGGEERVAVLAGHGPLHRTYRDFLLCRASVYGRLARHHHAVPIYLDRHALGESAKQSVAGAFQAGCARPPIDWHGFGLRCNRDPAAVFYGWGAARIDGCYLVFFLYLAERSCRLGS